MTNLITPIEVYTMVPKSQEAANVRHGEQVRDASQQAGVVQNIAKQANDNSNRTVKMSETENADYRYDAKEKGNNSYSSDGEKKRNGEEREKHEHEPLNMATRAGGIDIRI